MDTIDLRVSIAPLPGRDVEYFEEIPIPLTITSECATPLIVESVTLRFQTDRGMSDYFKKYDIASEIAPYGSMLTSIAVRPTLEFLTWTNEFHVLVRYKKVTDGMPGDQLTEKSPGTFVIVNPCSKKLGQIFISFKQPEDRALARIVGRVAERAGFQPYLKMDEPVPGVDMWDIIEPRLLESVAVAFIWTEHTEWGDGVEKEIEFSKAQGIHYIPLIQQHLGIPLQFRDSTIEYKAFDSEDPLREFAQAITALRETILANH